MILFLKKFWKHILIIIGGIGTLIVGIIVAGEYNRKTKTAIESLKAEKIRNKIRMLVNERNTYYKSYESNVDKIDDIDKKLENNMDELTNIRENYDVPLDEILQEFKELGY